MFRRVETLRDEHGMGEALRGQYLPPLHKVGARQAVAEALKPAQVTQEDVEILRQCFAAAVVEA